MLETDEPCGGKARPPWRGRRRCSGILAATAPSRQRCRVEGRVARVEGVVAAGNRGGWEWEHDGEALEEKGRWVGGSRSGERERRSRSGRAHGRWRGQEWQRQEEV